MNLTPANTIKLFSRAGKLKILSDIKAGSEIDAVIVKITGKKSAIIEIAGKQIESKFKEGVPAAKNLILKLEEKKGQTLVFKLVTQTKKDTLNRILNITVFQSEDIQDKTLYELSNIIRKNISIFNLNYYLLNSYHKVKRKENRFLTFFNRLIELNIDRETLIDISGLISGGGKYSFLIHLLLNQLFSKKDLFNKWTNSGENDSDKLIAELIYNINKIEENDEKKALIEELYTLLTQNINNSENGEVLFFDESEFKAVEYIVYNDSMIIALDLSNTGNIDILIKNSDENISISFFSNNRAVLESLKLSKDHLYSGLKMINKRVYINFFNSRNLLDDLSEILLYYLSGSNFDIKA